jgi:hypothetical protein
MFICTQITNGLSGVVILTLKLYLNMSHTRISQKYTTRAKAKRVCNGLMLPITMGFLKGRIVLSFLRHISTYRTKQLRYDLFYSYLLTNK